MISRRPFFALVLVCVPACANSATIKEDASKTPPSDECTRERTEEGDFLPWECLPPEVRNRKYPPRSYDHAPLGR